MSLVGWWKLQDNSLDSSKNAITATDHAMAWSTTEGMLGRCASFTDAGDNNDNSSYIRIDDVASYLVDGSRSVFCWIKCNGRTADTILAFENSDGSANALLFWIRTGGIISLYDGTWFVDSSGSVNDNTWHHIGYTYNAIESEYNFELFIDGESAGIGTGNPSNFAATNRVTIGMDWDTSSWTDIYQGYMNDVRIYDHVLSTKEIKELARCKIVHYKCEWDRDQTGDILRDSSGYDNHVTIPAVTNPTWTNASSPYGLGYYSLSGVLKRIITNNSPNILIPSVADYAWTICAWVKMTDTNGEQRLLSGLHGGCYLQSNTLAANKMVLYLASGYYATSDDATSYLYDNVWHHVAFVFDNKDSSRYIYVDGVDKTDTTVGDNGTTPVAHLTTLSWGFFLGVSSLTDMRIYNTPLSSTDILGIYKTSAQADNKGNLWC